MKKLTAIMMLMVLATTAMAIDAETLRKKGLPADAMPAISYFESLYSDNQPSFTEQDIMNSSFYGIDNEYSFFVQPQTKQDDDYPHINIWMYDTGSDKVSKVFTQRNNEYEDLFVTGIGWLMDKKSTFKNQVNDETKETIRIQEFKGSPVIVLQSEIWTGFSHSIRVTLIINPQKGETKRIDGEQFVSIFHTKTNMLMSAEQELAQDYILTTSTDVRTESMPLQENSEYIIYNQQFLTPILHIYTAEGKLVKSVTLPEDEVNMLR